MRRKLKCEIEFLQWTKHVLRGSSPPFMLCASNSSSLVQPASLVSLITFSTLFPRSSLPALYSPPPPFFSALFFATHLFFVNFHSHASGMIYCDYVITQSESFPELRVSGQVNVLLDMIGCLSWVWSAQFDSGWVPVWAYNLAWSGATYFFLKRFIQYMKI